MPTLSESRFLRLLTLCLLYLAQGLPWGFVTYTLAAWFAGQGMSEGELGAALGITSLPWTFKFLGGPVIDRWTLPKLGRRRPWILLAQGMMLLTILAILAVPDLVANLKLLVALLFLHNVFSALQDVAVDALAVDILPEHERGTANGLMYGSKYLGGAVGGAGLAKVMAASGLQQAILVQGAVLLFILLFPLFLREGGHSAAKAEEAAERGILENLTLLLRAFRLRSPFLGGIYAVLSTSAAGALGVIATVFYVQHLGWGDTAYAEFAGGPALLMGLLGAFLGGLLADLVGRKVVVIGGSTLLGLSWIAFALCEPYWTNLLVVKGFLLAEPLIMSMMAGGFFALCTDLSLPAIAATQFTAYMALSNLSTSLGQMLGGQVRGLADEYTTLFIGAGILQILVGMVLLPVDPLQARRALGEDEGEA